MALARGAARTAHAAGSLVAGYRQSFLISAAIILLAAPGATDTTNTPRPRTGESTARAHITFHGRHHYGSHFPEV